MKCFRRMPEIYRSAEPRIAFAPHGAVRGFAG